MNKKLETPADIDPAPCQRYTKLLADIEAVKEHVPAWTAATVTPACEELHAKVAELEQLATELTATLDGLKARRAAFTAAAARAARLATGQRDREVKA